MSTYQVWTKLNGLRPEWRKNPVWITNVPIMATVQGQVVNIPNGSGGSFSYLMHNLFPPLGYLFVDATHVQQGRRPAELYYFNVEVDTAEQRKREYEASLERNKQAMEAYWATFSIPTPAKELCFNKGSGITATLGGGGLGGALKVPECKDPAEGSNKPSQCSWWETTLGGGCPNKPIDYDVCAKYRNNPELIVATHAILKSEVDYVKEKCPDIYAKLGKPGSCTPFSGNFNLSECTDSDLSWVKYGAIAVGATILLGAGGYAVHEVRGAVNDNRT